jgi:hypothetical protein
MDSHSVEQKGPGPQFQNIGLPATEPYRAASQEKSALPSIMDPVHRFGAKVPIQNGPLVSTGVRGPYLAQI